MNALTLLVEQHDGCFLFQNPLGVVVMKVGSVQVGTKTIKLSCEDAQDKDEWRLRIKGLLANPGLPAKWPLYNICGVCGI